MDPVLLRHPSFGFVSFLSFFNPCVVAACRPPIPPLGCLFSFFLFLQNSGYDTDLPDEVQQEAVRRVCGALGMRTQFDAAVAAGELLELLESLPRGAVEASVRQMRGYIRTGEWPEPILTSPAPQRGRSPSPVDEWSDG